MLQYDPMHRPSISELMYHPWVQQTTPDAEEIRKEFERRALDVTKAREAEREERRQARENAFDEMVDSSCRANQPPMKDIDVYVQNKLSQHYFFTKLSPDMVEKRLLDFLRDKEDGTDPKVSDTKYEVDFTLGKTAVAKVPDETLLQSEADLEDELDKAMESLDLVTM